MCDINDNINALKRLAPGITILITVQQSQLNKGHPCMRKYDREGGAVSTLLLVLRIDISQPIRLQNLHSRNVIPLNNETHNISKAQHGKMTSILQAKTEKTRTSRFITIIIITNFFAHNELRKSMKTSGFSKIHVNFSSSVSYYLSLD